MTRSDAYRQFAAQCCELARVAETDEARATLLRLARLWSRLAEYVAKPAPAYDR